MSFPRKREPRTVAYYIGISTLSSGSRIKSGMTFKKIGMGKTSPARRPSSYEAGRVALVRSFWKAGPQSQCDFAWIASS